MARTKTRSGTAWTEADYRARGYGSVKLRLPLDALELLDQYASDAGVSRAEIVDALVRGGAAARKFVIT